MSAPEHQSDPRARGPVRLDSGPVDSLPDVREMVENLVGAVELKYENRPLSALKYALSYLSGKVAAAEDRDRRSAGGDRAMETTQANQSGSPACYLGPRQ